MSGNGGKKIVLEGGCFLPEFQDFVCERDCVHHGRVCRWLKIRRIV